MSVRVKAAKIKEGDLLVLETDSAYWQNNPAQLSRRDCVVSIASGNEITMALGHVATEITPGEVPDEIRIDVYGGESVNVYVSDVDPEFKRYRKNRRSIQIERGEARPVFRLSAIVLFLWRPS